MVRTRQTELDRQWTGYIPIERRINIDSEPNRPDIDSGSDIDTGPDINIEPHDGPDIDTRTTHTR